MPKYHKKQFEIDAIQQKGNNTQEVLDFLAEIKSLDIQWARYWIREKKLELYIGKTQYMVPDGFWIVNQFEFDLKIYSPQDFELMHDREDGEKTWEDVRFDEFESAKHKYQMAKYLTLHLTGIGKKKNHKYSLDQFGNVFRMT